MIFKDLMFGRDDNEFAVQDELLALPLGLSSV